MANPRTAYKLTTQDMTTYDGCKWEVGVKKTTSGVGDLCGPGWLHEYSDPLLAAAFCPIHTSISNPRLWRIEAGGKHLDDRGIKQGSTEQTLVEEIPMPVISTAARVRWGILCATEVIKDVDWRKWADNWLSGEDRSAESAAKWAAASASWSAASASWSSASWSSASWSSASWSAASWSAASASWSAAAAEQPIDLLGLLKQAIKEEAN